MGRTATIDEGELVARLGEAFRQFGYEGATLTLLAKVTGLQKASLYHRFPGGKEQMAREVLDNAQAWITAHILDPLRGPGEPSARVAAMVRQVDEFYRGGRLPCLLNVLASGESMQGPFATDIKAMMEAWIGALSAVAIDAGCDKRRARGRAERFIALLEGSLVVSRGLGTVQPFRDVLKGAALELLGDQRSSRDS